MPTDLDITEPKIKVVLQRSLAAIGIPFLVGVAVVLCLVLVSTTSAGNPYKLDLADNGTEVSGFYPVEQSPTGTFRWSRALSAVTLPALSASQIVTLTLSAPRPPGSIAPRLRVFIGDHKLADITVGNDWETKTIRVGPSLSPNLRLYLDSETFYPVSADDRRLGVAVREVETSAVPGRLGLTLPPVLLLLDGFALPVILALGTIVLRRGRPTVVAFAAGLSIILLTAAVSPGRALPLLTWTSTLAVLALAVVSLALPSRVYLWLCGGTSRLMTGKRGLCTIGSFHLVLGIAATWPLLPRMFTDLPGWPGDNFAFLYKIWWVKTALLEKRWPLLDPGSYFPFGFDLGQGEPTLANTVSGAILSMATGEVFAYNALVLISFVVTGVATYLLAREFALGRPASLLSSVVFAICPYRLGQLEGHLQLLGTGWIALTFLFAERLFKVPSYKNALLLGVAFALVCHSAWYYAFLTALALVPFGLVRFWNLRRNVDAWRLARSLIAFAVIALALTGPVSIPSLRLWATGNLSHSAKAADENSAAPGDYLLPNELQPFWGRASMRALANENIIESALYLGFVPLLFAAGGWVASGRRARSGAELAWVTTGLVALILSFGLSLHGQDGQVRFEFDGEVSAVPLPGQLLYWWLPFYGSMRAYARFGVVVMLSVALLSGWGSERLVARFTVPGSTKSRLLWICGTLAVLVDFWPSPYAWGTTRVTSDALDRFVAAQPNGVVMQMPLASTQAGLPLWRRVYYGKPLAYGYETFEPPGWRSGRAVLEHFPDTDSLTLMKSWHVTYVVVNGNSYGREWGGTRSYLASLPGLTMLGEFTSERIWRVDPAVLDLRGDMWDFAAPSTFAVYKLRP